MPRYGFHEDAPDLDWRDPPAARCYGCGKPMGVNKGRAVILPLLTPDGEHCAQVVPTYCAECSGTKKEAP